jgi:endonuclease G
MNKIILTTTFFFLCLLTFSQKILYDKNIEYVEHEYYSIYFSKNYKLPMATEYLLTKKMVEDGENDIERLNYFKKDRKLKSESYSHSDYTNSGYDRGHLVPARDLKFNNIAYNSTFLTSNICPQLKELNRYEWKYLEEKVRDLTLKKDSLLIFTGCVIKNKMENRLYIPFAFWKIIYKDRNVIAYILFNDKNNVGYEYCLTTVDYIEEITGFDFLYWLDDNIENRIENKIKKRILEWNRLKLNML